LASGMTFLTAVTLVILLILGEVTGAGCKHTKQTLLLSAH
jgi:hypothetical protein